MLIFNDFTTFCFSYQWSWRLSEPTTQLFDIQYNALAEKSW